MIEIPAKTCCEVFITLIIRRLFITNMESLVFAVCFGWGSSMDFVYVGPGAEVVMDAVKNTRAKDIRVVTYLQDLCGAKNLPPGSYRFLQEVLIQTPDFIPYYLAFTRTMYPTEFGRRVSYLRTVFQAAVKAGVMDEAAAAALCQDALTRVQQMVYGIF
jgi:hypothetical protein